MDNNKDPKEEFDQNDTYPSTTPTDSATTNDAESSSEEGTVKAVNNTEPDSDETNRDPI